MTPRASGVLSVIVPVLNAEDNIPELVRRLKAALDGGLSCDIIFVDDGSTDRTATADVAARRGPPDQLDRGPADLNRRAHARRVRLQRRGEPV